MSKAIVLRAGKQRLLAEVDLSVEVPADAEATSGRSSNSAKSDFQDVVNVGSVVRELEEVQDLIVTCCDNLYSAIQRVHSPDKVTIEFGIVFAGEFGVPMLTKASGEASFKVSIDWKGKGSQD